MDKPLCATDLDGRSTVDVEQVGWAYRVARAIQAGHKLGFFEQLLGGAATADEVAAARGTDPAMTERLLTLLAATGLLYRRPDGRFRLTDTGREAFDPDSPLSMNAGLAHARDSWEAWHRLEDLVREGKRGGPPRGEHAVFIGAMHDYAIRGRAQWLAGNVDLAGRERLLDLGGGPGTYSIALCETFRELASTIWDQPQTEPLARANVARYGMSERIGFVAGDWNVDPFGDGYDCALLSQVNHGRGSGAEERLAKTFRAMVPGATLMVQEFLLDDDRNGPLDAAVFYVHVGAYAVGELLAVIAGAGFEQASLISRGPHGNGLVTAVRP
ncbi:MAG: hypothetical protein HYU66_08790 [Armatimonadetes bacterium]|nr:hypothetical protein [Armatimonadota bacterium]